jgi:peptidoglycan DL-endopeptidase CwlO
MPCQSLRRLLFCLGVLHLQDAARAETPPVLEAPSLIASSELRDFESLAPPRKKLIEVALKTGTTVKGMPYLFGGNGAADGGFDCSGAMYAVLRQAGLDPPRTSSDQYLWVKKESELHEISAKATDAEDESLAALKPGDLIFWSGTYSPTDARTTRITHVAIFLGHEKKDDRPVMINATNGRSYRGKRCNGFGVYDFVIPRAGGKSKIVGYGTPPGLGGK